MTIGEQPKADAGPSGKSVLHPVYSVTNILNKVRMLDGVKVNYSAWVKLFTLHARGYKVLHHIDGTKPPAENSPEFESWTEIDAHVLQWIYGSVSDDILLRILETESTAYEAWVRLQSLYLNNKGSRAAALEHEFTNMSLEKASSLDDYCQRLKDIATQLTDVGVKVDNQRLVLQLVRGLPSAYDTVGAFINQQLLSFETARGMLQLEEQRQSVRSEATPSALVAPPSPTEASDSYGNGNSSQSSRNNNHNNGNGNWNKRNNNKKGSRNNWRNNIDKGGGNNSSGKTSTQNPTPISFPVWSGVPWPTPWSAPPCPYPSQQGWASPWQPQQQQQQRQLTPMQPRFSVQAPLSGQAYFAGPGTGFDPATLGQALQTMTIYPPDNSQWVMDTGASSHLTSESGTLNPPFNSSHIRSIFVGNGYSDWDNDNEEQ
ncbi:uncharacterized protein LOC141641400 [Silene latifolia]|uniref:uncharacterized protein LOC141641400 n=1 Tax=Silene latifolia TaxID=37657 RepID=UPI003D7738A4